jgi:voltage-gated potassium channel
MDDRSERIGRLLEPLLLIAALLVIPVIVIEESTTSAAWQTVATALNWISWLAFLVEAVVMLALVPDRRRWIREHPIELLIVLVTPPFVTAFASLRLLRVLALLRLIRLGTLARGLFSITGLRYAALLAAVTAFAGGAAFATLEQGESTGDGIYWAITTMTTVGYGDPIPTTAASKVLAVVVMLIGIGFVAVLTGAIAQRFVVPELEREIDREEADVEREVDELSVAILDELRGIRERLEALEARAG